MIKKIIDYIKKKWIFLLIIVLLVLAHIWIWEKVISSSCTIKIIEGEMLFNIIQIILTAIIGVLVFFMQRRIEKKFIKENEILKSELAKGLIKANAIYDFKQLLTKESFDITINLYHKLFETSKSYQKLWNRKIEKSDWDKNYQNLQDYQILLFSNQILLKKDIFEKYKNIIGNMINVSLIIATDSKIDASFIKEIKNSLSDLTNLIRTHFGLDDLPGDLIANDIQPTGQ